jgi:UDP-N-acetylmuramate dehydrogenase
MKLDIVGNYSSDRISLYRTSNTLAAYGELRDPAQLPAIAELRKTSGRPLFVVGNGSNLFLSKPRIDSLVVKNCLARVIERRDGNEIWVSSTSNVMEVLRFCHRESLESFYYLASVPATIGGAVAMNAGRGRRSGGSIFDFIRKIRYYDLDELKVVEVAGACAVLGYRETIFTGSTSKVILEASFAFDKTGFRDNPIEARKTYAAGIQDYTGPNCGSVFKLYDPLILRFLQRTGLGWMGARYSKKTLNWIVNDSSRPGGIDAIIKAAEIMHRVMRRPIQREVITVA